MNRLYSNKKKCYTYTDTHLKVKNSYLWVNIYNISILLIHEACTTWVVSNQAVVCTGTRGYFICFPVVETKKS